MLYHYVIGLKWGIQCILPIALRCVPVSGSNNTKFFSIIIPGTLLDGAYSSMCRAGLFGYWYISGSEVVFTLCGIHWLPLVILQIFILCWPALGSWITLAVQSMRFLDQCLVPRPLFHFHVCFLFKIMSRIDGPSVLVYWGDLSGLQMIENNSDLFFAIV